MDASTRKVVVSLRISSDQWKSFVGGVRGDLKQLNADALATSQEKLARMQSELALNKQDIADQKLLTAQGEAMAAFDKARLAWQQKQSAEIKTKTAAAVLETTELKTQEAQQMSLLKLEQERNKTAQSQLRLQTQITKAAAAAAGGGGRKTGAGGGGGEGSAGGGGNILGDLGRTAAGFLGGGPIGMIAAGAGIGDITSKMLESLGEKLREFVKDAVDATGAAGQLREQFNKLASKEGADPEEFLNKLRVATRGLIEDNTVLIKTANNFMQGPLKMQPDQIAHLTEMTVALARAQSTDATQALDALSRAALTGQTRQLSWELALNKSELSVRSLGQGVAKTAEAQLNFGLLQDALARKLAEVGTPATTLVEIFKQIHQMEHAFEEDMAFGATHSATFQKSIQDVSSWLLKITPEVLDFALSVGKNLGNAFQNFLPVLRSIGDVFSAMFTEAKALWALWQDASPINLVTASFGDLKGNLTATQYVLLGLTSAFTVTALSMRDVAATAELVSNVFEDIKNKKFGNLAADWALYTSSLNDNSKTALDNVQKAYDTMSAINTPKPDDTSKDKDHTEPPSQEILKQRAEITAKVAEEEAKIRYETRLLELHDEEDAVKKSYESGLTTLADYLSQEKALRDQEHIAKLAQIETERKAKIAALQIEATGIKNPTTGELVGGMDSVVLQKKIDLINDQAAAEKALANNQAQKGDQAAQQEALEDQIKARQQYVNTINKIEQEGVQTRTKILESEFKAGNVDVTDYISQRKELAAEELSLENQAAQAKYDAGLKNFDTLATLRGAELENEVKYEQTITELVQSEGQLRLQYMQQKFDAATKLLQTNIKLDQSGGSITGNTAAAADIEALDALTNAYIKQLQTEQEATAIDSERYLKLGDMIVSAKEQVQNLNVELFKTHDLLAPVGDLFGKVAENMGNLLTGRWQSMLANVSKVLKDLSAAAELQAKDPTNPGMVKNLGTSVKDLFRKVPKPQTPQAKTAMEVFQQGLKDGGAAVTNTGKSIATAFNNTTQTVNGFKDNVNTAAYTLLQFAQAAQQAIKDLQAPPKPKEPSAPPPTYGPYTDEQKTELAKQEHPEGSTRIPTYGPYTNQQQQQIEKQNNNIDVVGNMPEQVPTIDMSADIPSKLSDIGDAATKVATPLKSFAEKLSDATKFVTEFVGTVGSVINSIAGAQSAGSGAVGGATATAGLGGILGPLMSSSQYAGPIGMAIGATVGGIFGGIVGAKQHKADEAVKSITKQFDLIVQQLNNGTQTLGTAIQQLQAERQSAVDILGGSKKGQKQLPAVLEQFDQQIQALEAQQKKTLDDLNLQVGKLAEPEQWQSVIDSIDQIIEKYKEYASAAAGNAAAVAQANAFLTESLQNYANTVKNQLGDANAQAIQDAIQLLDLEKQRNDLIQNEARSEYNIMTQGVTVRNTGTAAIKGQEIAQLRYDRDQQLQDIDEQTALEQYKVDAESKIFNLATDRIGLEQQLLTAQEAQYDQQIAGVVVLQQTLDAITNALNTGLPNSIYTILGGVGITSILQLLGLQPIIPTGTPTTSTPTRTGNPNGGGGVDRQPPTSRQPNKEVQAQTITIANESQKPVPVSPYTPDGTPELPEALSVEATAPLRVAVPPPLEVATPQPLKVAIPPPLAVATPPPLQVSIDVPEINVSGLQGALQTGAGAAPVVTAIVQVATPPPSKGHTPQPPQVATPRPREAAPVVVKALPSNVSVTVPAPAASVPAPPPVSVPTQPFVTAVSQFTEQQKGFAKLLDEITTTFGHPWQAPDTANDTDPGNQAVIKISQLMAKKYSPVAPSNIEVQVQAPQQQLQPQQQAQPLAVPQPQVQPVIIKQPQAAVTKQTLPQPQLATQAAAAMASVLMRGMTTLSPAAPPKAVTATSSSDAKLAALEMVMGMMSGNKAGQQDALRKDPTMKIAGVDLASAKAGLNMTPPTVDLTGTRLQVNAHQQMFDLASARSKMEMDVIVARNKQLVQESAHVSAVRDLLKAASATTIQTQAAGSVEDQLNKVYQTRGRYGLGQFTRQTI